MAARRYNDSRLGEILLNQSSRARQISITVLASGTVRLTYPARVSTDRALEMLSQRTEWVQRAKLRVEQRRKLHSPAIEADPEELRHRAKEYLPRRVEELSQATGLKYSRLTIRSARTKWGSCTSIGNISLSLYLMALPKHLVDFVIIHELCHTIHFNHSAQFHELVDRIMQGRERELSRELKGYSIR